MGTNQKLQDEAVNWWNEKVTTKQIKSILTRRGHTIGIYDPEDIMSKDEIDPQQIIEIYKIRQ